MGIVGVMKGVKHLKYLPTPVGLSKSFLEVNDDEKTSDITASEIPYIPESAQANKIS